MEKIKYVKIPFITLLINIRQGTLKDKTKAKICGVNCIYFSSDSNFYRLDNNEVMKFKSCMFVKPVFIEEKSYERI